MAKRKKATSAEDVANAGAEIGVDGELITDTASTPARNLVTDAAVMYFDPDMFTVDPAANNLRASGGTFNDPKFFKLKDSIAARGVLQPVLFNMEDDAPKLRIGFRRLEAVKQLRAENPDNPRFTTIPAVALNGGATALTLLMANLDENEQRKDLSALDKAHVASKLQAAGMTQQAIADVLGLKSKGQISKLLALLKLPEDLQKQVHEGKLDAEAAYQLSRKPADVQEAAGATLAEAETVVPELGLPETTGNRRRKKKAAKKITRKAAKAATVTKHAKTGKKTLAAGDKTRSRDDVFGFFSTLAKPAKDAKVKDAVQAIGKAVIAFMDGRAGAAKLAGVLTENTKGR